MNTKILDDISFKMFKTDYQYIGLDVCKVAVLEEYIKKISEDQSVLIDALKSSDDLRQALNHLEGDVNYYGGGHLKESWNIVSDYVTKAEETIKALNL
jgi:hypothetical protein